MWVSYFTSRALNGSETVGIDDKWVTRINTVTTSRIL